jgi:predicted amidohydrolase YtcJ
MRLVLAAVGLVLAASASAQELADTIYAGGMGLTMNEAAPRAEAVAVKDGRILAAGARADVMRHRGGATTMIDLAGRAMIPGFVDAHGHVFMIGLQALAANLLPAPDGEVNAIASLQRVLCDWSKAHPDRVKRVNLIVGFGYDDSQLAEQRHPTREDLGAVAADIPVYVIHQSGHLGAGNAKALEIAGITAESKEQPGGVIRRQPGSTEPDGVLEEAPHFLALTKLLGSIGPEGTKAMFRAGTELIASYGYTTAQEGRSTPGQVAIMEAVAAGNLKIDVVTYPDVLVDFIRGYWFAPTHPSTAPGLLEHLRGPLRRLYQFRLDADYDLIPLARHSVEEAVQTAQNTLAEIVQRTQGGYL